MWNIKYWAVPDCIALIQADQVPVSHEIQTYQGFLIHVSNGVGMANMGVNA